MTTMSKELLGQQIVAARKARGLNQEDIAAATGRSVKQVGRWENGKNAPGGVALSLLVEFFRKKSDRDDLALLETAVVQGVQDAAEGLDDLPEQERRRLVHIMAKLAPHRRKFDMWLLHGELMIDELS